MFIHQKIETTIKKNFKKGEELIYKEIVSAVRNEFPEVKKNCILPSDLCDNHRNKDPRSGKYKIFHRIGYGRYEVII